MIKNCSGDDSVTAKEQLEFLEGLFESADIGICVTDSERRFVMVNPAYCRTYGYAAEDLIGQPFTKMLPPDQHEFAGNLHDAFIAGSPESAGEWDVVHKSGDIRRVLVTAGRVILEDGRRYKVTTVSDITEVRRTERELAALSTVIEQTSHGIIVTDPAGKTTWVNQATVDLTGFSPEELYGQKPGDLFQGEGTEPAAVRHMSQQLAAGNGFQVEVLNYTKSGEPYSLHISCAPVRDSSGTLQGFMALQTDITAQKESERRIAQAAIEAQRLGIAIDQSPASIVITDCDGNIDFVNQTCIDNSGYSREELVGQNPRIFQSEHTEKRVYQDLWGTISAGKTWQGRLVNRRKDGSEYVEWSSINPVVGADDEVICYIAVKEDITEREQLTERLQSMERYDALTGVSNRAFFVDTLEKRLQSVASGQGRQPLAVVNIDRFKSFNALHGHQTGDELLQALASNLQGNVGDQSLIARLGPDEFGVLPPIQPDSQDPMTRQEELRWIQRIQRAIRTTLSALTTVQQTTVSIGVAYCDPGCQGKDQCHPGDMLRMAELAVRSAKASGGGQLAFYDAKTSRHAEDALQLERDLGQALSRGELYLVFQAQIAPGGRLAGAEALLRWQHATRGGISPGQFIPLAEDTGQIVQIGGWVLEQALDALAVMQRHTPDLTVSVNVSPVQIRRPEFIDEVAGLLERVGVDPSGLILEITENVFMSEPELAGERLGALRDLGLKISIDDFGTGYSSLTYLKRLPVHELKIDQSFVNGLPDDAADAALVKIILSAADELKLRVVAEGVELASQAQFFEATPNVFLQGFLFDRPIPVDEWYERWLR